MSDREVLSDQEARPAAEAIALALARWTHDCNRVGYGVIECGGCGVELNGFSSRDGEGLGEDIRLTLSQKGWLVVPVSEVADAKEEHAAHEQMAADLQEAQKTEALLRASLERYGRHDGGCEAAAPFWPGRCVCGYHKALAQFARASDEQEATG